MLITEQEARKEALLAVAYKMMTAARTAPKGRGRDTLQVAVVTDGQIQELAGKMDEFAKEKNAASFARDAENIRQSEAIVLIGTTIEPLRLAVCGICGFPNCAEKDKHVEIPCSFNTVDLGIAVGSAVSIAADARVDNRVMYTAGLAAVEMGMLKGNVKVAMGIPISATAKSPYFDRR